MQGRDGVMGEPLVRRLTVRSGLHPESGAPAHLAILGVSASVPPPRKPDEQRDPLKGESQLAWLDRRLLFDCLAITHYSLCNGSTASFTQRCCAFTGVDRGARQDVMQDVAQMLMREVPGLAGVVQHKGEHTAPLT